PPEVAAVEASEEESEGPSVEESVFESIAGDEPAAAGGYGEAAEREDEGSKALERDGEAPVTVEAAEETAAAVEGPEEAPAEVAAADPEPMPEPEPMP